MYIIMTRDTGVVRSIVYVPNPMKAISAKYAFNSGLRAKD